MVFFKSDLYCHHISQQYFQNDLTRFAVKTSAKTHTLLLKMKKNKRQKKSADWFPLCLKDFCHSVTENQNHIWTAGPKSSRTICSVFFLSLSQPTCTFFSLSALLWFTSACSETFGSWKMATHIRPSVVIYRKGLEKACISILKQNTTCYWAAALVWLWAISWLKP